jgi:hypothetical protein
VSRALLLSFAVLLVLVGVDDASPHNPITTTVLFNREIATVLNAKCASCHAEGRMAMPLGTWAEARPWAVAIKEEVLGRRMPPWPAERGYGAFANDLSLTPLERDFLISWIDGGVPEGDGTPPPFVDHSAHWMLGAPDATARGRAQGEPAGGVRRFVVDPGVEKDTFVRALDVKIADPQARAAFLTTVRDGSYLGGWTPWHGTTVMPDGAAIRVRAGERIALDIAGGTSAEPPTVGFYLAERPAATAVNIVLDAHQPAGARRVQAAHAIGAAQTLLGFRVELSPGATTFELRARHADGRFQPLLLMKDIRSEWPVPFVLRDPLALEAGASIQATAYYAAAAAAPPRLTVSAVAVR